MTYPPAMVAKQPSLIISLQRSVFQCIFAIASDNYNGALQRFLATLPHYSATFD
jgi:hypothetical protein